jgi:dienelactone hydrolase
MSGILRMTQRVFQALLFILLAVPPSPAADEVKLIGQDQYKTFYRVAKSQLMKLPREKAWQKAVPGIREVRIGSSADGKIQKALFYDSGSPRKKPLLVALHSWSADYLQHYGIPYGIWAHLNDWVMIHPDYRGAYTNPMATASEFAVRDILDALEYAKKHARIDESRIYLSGFSGGAMTALIMAGRYPELWTAVSAWVPVYDLPMWYGTTRGSRYNYARFIRASCGGPPLQGTKAEKECRKRSVSAYLKNAKGKSVKIYIAAGVKDPFVPASHALLAFNDLADKKDRLAASDIRYVASKKRLPPGLAGSHSEPLYADVGHRVIFSRTSGNATVTIFNGRHDLLYNAGLFWLSRQRR